MRENALGTFGAAITETTPGSNVIAENDTTQLSR